MYIKLFFLFIFISLNISCNHLFYYPSRQHFLNPEDFKLSYQSYLLPGKNGIELSAWHFPSQSDNKNSKDTLVIHLHGNAENISSHFLFTAWLAKHGYDLLVFDYRGYGNSSDVEPNQTGLIEDTCSVLEWVSGNESLKTKQVFIVAQSLGGAVIFPALADCRDKIQNLRGVVIDSSFGSYRNTARMKLNDIALTWAFQYPLSWLISDEIAPKDAATTIDVPVLFFHSPEDPVVPYAAGRELYEAVPNKKRFVDVPISGHTTAFIRQSEQTRQILLDFLNHKLKLN